MEPMVVCAMGIVVYFGNLTVRDILFDLQQEGIVVRVPSRGKKKEHILDGSSGAWRTLEIVGGLTGAESGQIGHGNC